MTLVDIPEGATFDDVCDAFDQPLAELAGQLNTLHAQLVAVTEQLIHTGAWQQGSRR